jgi:hypothetical protein
MGAPQKSLFERADGLRADLPGRLAGEAAPAREGKRGSISSAIIRTVVR